MSKALAKPTDVVEEINLNIAPRLFEIQKNPKSTYFKFVFIR